MTTLDLVAHQRTLNFAPGSRQLYSHAGYALAGLIVHRVSGTSRDGSPGSEITRAPASLS